MDVWGPARVRGQGHERYFLLVVDDYSRYTTVFPLRSKGEVTEVLIDWIRAARLRLRESFGSDFPVLRLHSDRGGEFSSARLGAFCPAQGIRQTFTLPASPQQNGIAERHIGMVTDVTRMSMIHAAAPHFLWPFAVQYAAHQLNLQPRVSLPETSPTLLWTGKVGDASAFRFYHLTSRRVLSSQDVTFDESVPYYRLFSYRTASLPPPPLFLAPGPPPVDHLPPQGPAPSGVSQVDAVEPVEVAVDSGAATGTEPAGAGSGGAGSGGAETEGAEPGGAGTGGAEPGGAASGGVEPWGAEHEGAATGGSEPGGAEPGVTEPGGAEPGGAGSARVASRGVSSRREVLSPQELHEWFARRWSRAAGAGGIPAPTGSGDACLGGAGAAGPGDTTEAAGVSPTGGSAGASKGSGAAGSAGPGAAGATGVGVAGGVGAGSSAGAGPSEGTGAGAPAGSPGAVPAGSGGAPRPRPTSGMGLVLGGRRPVVLTGHADASWADDQATQRSSQGYTFSLGSGSVSWRSTRSSSILSSSCEAEIYAGAMAVQELRLLTYLLTDLGEQPRSPPVLYVDNKAMLALFREHRLEHRTKHIALRYFLARELQQRGQLRLAYVASEANTADIFTKALAPGDHQLFCTLLGLVPTWPHLLTS
ncbi:unnamed protein product [Closterium sp. NIES-53]